MSWVIELCSKCHKEMRNYQELRGHVETCGHKGFEVDKEMTNNSITEAYFVARGWNIPGSPRSEGFPFWPLKDLPNILESFPDFKREVLEVMEGEKFDWHIQSHEWAWMNHASSGQWWFAEPIIDNEILKAAVLAATRYWEQKK